MYKIISENITANEKEDYEVCDAAKRFDATANIPVMLISAVKISEKTTDS